MAEIIAICLFITWLIITCALNAYIDKKIRKFNKRLADFEKAFYGSSYEPVINTTPECAEFVLLESAPERLDRIEFCLRHLQSVERKK